MISGPSNDVELSDLCSAAKRQFDAGRAAWPSIALEFEAFERYFARHATVEIPPGELHASDMYLACACSYGIASALAELEGTFRNDVARAVASIDSSHAFVEDTLQATRERLLTGKGPSKIADYAGRSSLRSWLCAVAVRWAIGQRRRKREQHHEPFNTEHDMRLVSKGPDFEYLRRRYKSVFEQAVRTAVDRLPAKQRLLLRLNLVDGMSVDKLGTVYRVGRSTAARWLATARQELLEGVRRHLRHELRVTSAELDSLGADLRSQLDVSLHKLLARTNG
jgi:RNA polymerase sigma-70 factor (ECF subfamily)